MGREPGKIEKAFQIAAKLADVDCETALRFKERAEDLRSKIVFENSQSESSFLASLKLAIRTYRGLLPTKVDDDKDLTRIVDLVKKTMSIGNQVECFSDLAFTFFRSSRAEAGGNIVRKHIRPLLGQISDEDQRRVFELWAYAAPPLYKAGINQTLDELERKLPTEYRDYALSNIAAAILDGIMPADPIDSDSNRSRRLSVEEILELRELISRVETDSTAYWIFEQVIDSILEDKRQRTYDRGFRISIEDQLRSVAEKSFPHQNYIQHEGYLILAKGDLLLLRDTYTRASSVHEWLDLLEKARSIGNEADRAFVLSRLVEKCPSSRDSTRKHQVKVLDEVEYLIRGFPSVLDRLNRFESLAQAARGVDGSRARDYYKRAVRLLYAERGALSTPMASKIQRRIVSAAYRIDPDFATSLSNLADDDPAHQQELNRNVQRLKRRESISTSSDEHGDEPDPDFPHVCWESLGSLNAGRLPGAVRKDRAQAILKKARGYSLKDAYPIQSFITEGLVRTYKSTDAASSIIRPLFEANLQNTHLVERLAIRSSSKQSQAKTQAAKRKEKPQTFAIGRGERSKAFQIIGKWVAENVTRRLIICDQYFGPEEVEALSLIHSVVPNCDIEILSSEKHHRRQGIGDLRKAYAKAWRDKYDHEVPTLRIVVAGMQDEGGRSPVHDRWWLADESGLRLGTSFNGLGQVQTSEISIMDDVECNSKMEEVEGYLSTRTRELGGTGISYRVENL